MSKHPFTRNHRRQVAAGTVSLALAGISALTFIAATSGGEGLASRVITRSHHAGPALHETVEAASAAAFSPAARVQVRRGFSSAGSFTRGFLGWSAANAAAGVSAADHVVTNDPNATDEGRWELPQQVALTLPSYRGGRLPSATTPSVRLGNLPTVRQTGPNEVTVQTGTTPTMTPASVDPGTIGHVGTPGVFMS